MYDEEERYKRWTENCFNRIIAGDWKFHTEYDYGSWLNAAIHESRTDVANVIFNHLKVPSDLSIEEKIAYYRLFGMKDE